MEGLIFFKRYRIGSYISRTYTQVTRETESVFECLCVVWFFGKLAHSTSTQFVNPKKHIHHLLAVLLSRVYKLVLGKQELQAKILFYITLL